MPAKRTHGKARNARITPEAVDIFKAGRELDPYSDEGNKYAWQLHDALDLKPWQISPLWIRPDHTPETHGHFQPDMLELRRQLEEACA